MAADVTTIPDKAVREEACGAARPAEVLFPEARRRRRRRWSVAAICTVLVASAIAAGLLVGRSSAPASPRPLTAPVMATATQSPAAFARACAGVRSGSLFGLTKGGDVVRVNPSDGAVVGVLATGATPLGGLALDPHDDSVFVTAAGSGGQPAVWRLSCHGAPSVVADDAELPASSPHGGALAYVTLSRTGRQSAVIVVRPGRTSHHPARLRTLRVATHRVPIRALALGPDATTLAVSGSYVNRSALPGTSPVGVIDPRTASSLATLSAVETPVQVMAPIHRTGTADGGWGPGPMSFTTGPGAPTVATYLPNGLLLVDGAKGSHGLTPSGIAMPYTAAQDGQTGSKRTFLVVAAKTGRIDAISVGPHGAVALVTSTGRLRTAAGVWDLPFGPWAFTDYGTAPTPTTIGAGYTAVAWTAGHATDAMATPPKFPTAPTPTVVGQPEANAAAELAALGIPSIVGQTVHEPTATAAPGTVVQQSPPGGTVDTCDCAIDLTVVDGGTMRTTSLPRGRKLQGPPSADGSRETAAP